MLKKVLPILVAVGLAASFLVTPALAADTAEKTVLPTSPLYLLVQAKEAVQNFFTFSKEAKAQLTEQFAEQRIKEVEYATEIGDTVAVEKVIARYQTQKAQVLNIVEGLKDGDADNEIVNDIKEGVLEQQKVLTEVQQSFAGNDDLQQVVVDVQKDVAEQVNNVVKVIQGEDAAAEMDVKTEVVWYDPSADPSGGLPPLPDNWEYAPGTSAGGGADTVIEGGPSQRASGTGGGESDVKVVGDQPGVKVDSAAPSSSGNVASPQNQVKGAVTQAFAGGNSLGIVAALFAVPTITVGIAALLRHKKRRQ